MADPGTIDTAQRIHRSGLSDQRPREFDHEVARKPACPTATQSPDPSSRSSAYGRVSMPVPNPLPHAAHHAGLLPSWTSGLPAAPVEGSSRVTGPEGTRAFGKTQGSAASLRERATTRRP